MKKISTFPFLIAIALTSALPLKLNADSRSPIRIYVDRNAVSSGTGQSWETAFRYLQDALAQSVDGRRDEIWIAAGTYYPDEGAGLTRGDRTLSFDFPSGIKVFGSFSGSETSLTDRIPTNPRTILSGVISDDINLRSQNVCTITDDATFDGIDVTGGNANSGTVYDKVNGAIMPRRTSSNAPTLLLRNCAFYDNRASQANGVTGEVVLTAIACNFINNSAGGYSGVGGGDPLWTLINCVFEGNRASHGGVGYWGNRIAVNCVFVGNSAWRGGVFGGLGTARFINCTFANNSGVPIFGGSYYTLQVQSANSIFWDDDNFTTLSNFRPTHFSNIVTHELVNNGAGLRAPNIIKGGSASLAETNTEGVSPTNDYGDDALIISTDPQFTAQTNPRGEDNKWRTGDDGLRPLESSEALSAGLLVILPSDYFDINLNGNTEELIPLDISGHPRVRGGAIDLGAYQILMKAVDTDGDGVNDYREAIDGTDPNDPHSFNPLSIGLVAHYPFDGNANDESGFSDHGVVVGSASLTWNRFGHTNSAYLFDGESQHITATGSYLPRNTEPRSVSLWVRTDDLPKQPQIRIPLGWGSNTDNQAFGVIMGPSIPATWGVQFWGGGQDIMSDVNVEQQWHHLVAAYDGSNVALYVDGVSQLTGTKHTSTGAGGLSIGAGVETFVDSFETAFKGAVDDVRIYNRALSTSDIHKLYYQEAFGNNQRHFVTANPDRFGLVSFSDYQANRENGRQEVVSDPSAFNLFTRQELDDNRTAGQLDVIRNPMSYGLYTSDSILDLAMGGLMMQKQGLNITVVFQPQTTTDLATIPFTNSGTPITNTIPMPEDKGFIRIQANPTLAPSQ
jgi:hypothetical protein